jgi:hypothetical protein
MTYMGAQKPGFSPVLKAEPQYFRKKPGFSVHDYNYYSQFPIPDSPLPIPHSLFPINENPRCQPHLYC